MYAAVRDRLKRLYRGAAAAGSRPGLERCDRTTDGRGYVCRWARARTSPDRLAQLGRDLQSIVGEEARARIRWGLALERSLTLQELGELPIESLRKADDITIAAAAGEGGWRVEVSYMAAEPALLARVQGPPGVEAATLDAVAQRVKDAVELGDWNPVSRLAITLPLIALVGYAPLFAVIFLLPSDATTLNIVAAWFLAIAIALPFFLRRIYPPVEVYAVEQTTIGSVLKTAVPILAGAASIAVTVLKLAGVGGD